MIGNWLIISCSSKSAHGSLTSPRYWWNCVQNLGLVIPNAGLIFLDRKPMWVCGGCFAASETWKATNNGSRGFDEFFLSSSLGHFSTPKNHMIVGGDTWAIEAVRTVDAGVAAWKDESCHPFGSGREAKRFARETARRLFLGLGGLIHFNFPLVNWGDGLQDIPSYGSWEISRNHLPERRG